VIGIFAILVAAFVLKHLDIRIATQTGRRCARWIAAAGDEVSLQGVR